MASKEQRIVGSIVADAKFVEGLLTWDQISLLVFLVLEPMANQIQAYRFA